MLALVAFAATLATPPAPTRWVEDHAAMMSESARIALDTRLETYEHATGHQVVVWIGKTLGGAPLDDWAVKTFAAWKLGRSGKDDGIAIFVLADDRAIDIEVGYGLEDKVPDAIASRIIDEVMIPKLRANDRDGAITTGADAVVAAIEGHAWSPGIATAEHGPSLATWIIGGLAVLAFLVLLVLRPRATLAALWMVSRGIGGSVTSGFRGGGGRSGGGGARGRW